MDEEELDHQRHLNEIYTKDVIIKIRLITFIKNLESKYDKKTCIKKAKIFKDSFRNYRKKMVIYQQNNNLYQTSDIENILLAVADGVVGLLFVKLTSTQFKTAGKDLLPL